MGAKKIIKSAETIMRIIKSPKDALLSDVTRRNPKQKEIKNQLKIIKSTEKLSAKTRVIPNTKEALAKQKKSIESREKTGKNTDGTMGKGGGNSSSGSGNKKKKSFIKKVTGGLLSLFGLAAGKEIFSDKEKENISEFIADTVTNEKKLKALNDSVEELEKLKADHKLFADLDGLDEAKKEELKAKVEKYRKKESGIMDVLKDTWTDSEFNDEGKKRGFFSRIFRSAWRVIPNFMFFFGVKRAEKKGLFDKYEKLKLQKAEADLVAEDLKKKGKKVGKFARNIKRASRISKTSGVAFLRQQKILKSSSMIEVFENKIRNISPQTKNAATISKNARIKLFRKVKEKNVQLAFQDAMKHGKINGLPKLDVAGKLKRFSGKFAGFAGGMGVASALNLAAYDAINAGKFSTFGKSLLSKETLTEAFIPGVGTWRSIKRSSDPNAPTWLKAADIGLNIVGDVMLTAGYIGSIFSFGTSGVAGIAGRTAVVGLGKRLLTKQGLKIAAKQGAKSAVKSLKQGAKASLVTSPIMISLQIFAKKFNPKKVEQAFIDNVLTDEQRRSIEISKRIEPEVRQLNTGSESDYQMAA